MSSATQLAPARRGFSLMCAPDSAFYTLLSSVLAVVLGPLHPATRNALSEVVGALLLAQSLHPADLARALPALRTARARQAQRRIRRILGRACLSSRALTPLFIRVALTLVHSAEVLLVLDSTRCPGWEIFTLGVRFHGRVLPIAWEILPHPWPKGRFTPTVLALVDRTLDAWPADRAVHLVADRGFPSLRLFRCLERRRAVHPLGYTVRVRASDWVRLASGLAVKVGDLEQGVAEGTWSVQPASYQQRGRSAPPARLVLGRGLPLYPVHQMGPADRARRTARAHRRIAHRRSMGQPLAETTDRVWALVTTKSTWVEGVRAYQGRFATEGTYRDVKGWDLTAVAGHETDPGHLDGVLGLASLADLVQTVIGAAAGRTRDRSARARQAQWSTTDRLSPFWRGRQVLRDRAYDWRPFVAQALHDLTAALAGSIPPHRARTSSSDADRQEAA